MDQIKHYIGPFEIFSGFISGLPFLLFVNIIWKREFDFNIFFSNIILDSTLSNLIFLVVTSYLVGIIAAPISYRYFKYAGKMLGMNYLLVEEILLGDWDRPFRELSVNEFLDLPFEKRITYLVKRRYGKLNKMSHLNDYLVTYLRQDAVANAVKADGFIARNIMLRNISLGFLLLSLAFVYLLIMVKQPWICNVIFAVSSLTLSFVTLQQAHTFRHWWTREAILGFYNLEIKFMSPFDKEHNNPTY